MIKGVLITHLKTFPDERGKVMHMMKNTDHVFKKFGEIYFSLVFPGKIKAWHRNKRTTKNYAVVEGNIRLAIYDGKEIQEIQIGEDNYCLVTIPPGIWSGFQAIGGKKAIIADLTDFPHDPDDSEKVDPEALTDYWKDKL